MRYKKIKFNIKITLVLTLTGLILTTGAALAGCDKGKCTGDTPIRLQVNIPLVGESCNYEVQTMDPNASTLEMKTETKTVTCVSGFPDYIKGIYNFFVSIVGILAVIMIMLGGFQWLLAAGNAQKISGAKTTIISAIMGLVLTLGTYSILNWVNPNLTKLKLSVPTVKLEGAMTIGKCEKKHDPLLKLFGHDAPKCGFTYLLEDNTNGDKYCSGFMVDKKLFKEDMACLTTDNFTTVAKAVDFVTIIDDDSPFGTQQWETFDNKDCGELYVYVEKEKKIENPTNPQGGDYYKISFYKIGTKHNSGDTCVIRLEKDGKTKKVKWDITKESELIDGSKGTGYKKVGELKTAGLEKW